MKKLVTILMIMYSTCLLAQDSLQTQVDSTNHKLNTVLEKLDIIISGHQLVMESKALDSLRIQIIKDAKEIAKLKKDILERDSLNRISRQELEKFKDEQKEYIEKEIELMLNLSYEINPKLLESFLQRAKLFKANNEVKIQNFYKAYNMIKEGYELINKPVDSPKAKMVSDKLRGDNIFSQFKGLDKNKGELLGLIGRYCEKHTLLNKYINDAKIAVSEDMRRTILTDIEWEFRSYPYLMQELEKAKMNKNFALIQSNCP
jgi:hypothetical protein